MFLDRDINTYYINVCYAFFLNKQSERDLKYGSPSLIKYLNSSSKTTHGYSRITFWAIRFLFGVDNQLNINYQAYLREVNYCLLGSY